MEKLSSASRRVAIFAMSHYMRNSSATQERTICRKGCHAASFSQVAGRAFWRLRGSFLVHGCPHALYFAGVLYVYSRALPSAEYTAQSVYKHSVVSPKHEGASDPIDLSKGMQLCPKSARQPHLQQNKVSQGEELDRLTGVLLNIFGKKGPGLRKN